MKTLVICSSSTFYEHVNQLVPELEQKGYKVVVPFTAQEMEKNGNYNAEERKTWHDNPEDFVKKRELMDKHFAEVLAGDAILVVNDAKKGIDGYIGSNVLMEMTIAYINKKPIYVLNNVSKDLGCWEEVMGIGSIFLDGDIKNLPKSPA